MNAPKPNDAIQFLRQVTPPGVYGTVVAIDPAKKAGELGQIVGLGYTLDTVANVAGFITEHAANRHNLYWSVNPTANRINKKPRKDDIVQLARLHVDIDNPIDEILAALRSYRIPPTQIIFSGHGYWGFWQLREPIHVNGNVVELEAYNAQLVIDFGADHCHNLDRIARLPGTTNWPTKRKRDNGITEPVEAYVVESHADRIYSLADFGEPSNQAKAIAAGKVGATPKSTLATVTPIFGGKRISKDRSADLHSKVHKAVRAAQSDEAIHVQFDNHPHAADQDNPQRTVQRCIDKARAAVASDDIEKTALLEKMNAEHAVISWGGKTVVLTEKTDGAFTLSGFADFKNWYSNRHMCEGPLALWWLRHPERRQYRNISFSPGKDIPGVYNLWKGFGVTPRAGSCHLFLDLIKSVICGGDEKLYKYVLAWCADMVQNPCDRPGISIVLRGITGAGKGTFALMLGALVGRSHFQHVRQAGQLVGRFNAHLANALLVFGDECFFAGDRSHEGAIKAFITEPTQPIEYKGKDIVHIDNYARLIIASNKEWVVPAEMSDRRFLVLDVADIHAKETAYFNSIRSQMDHGGREALLDYLLHYDLSQFNLRDVPDTAAKLEQVEKSMDAITAFWYRRLNDGAQVATQGEWQEQMRTGDLFDEYARFASVSGERHRHETSFGSKLHKMCPSLSKDTVTVDKFRVKVYSFPDLYKCRKEFCKWANRRFEWDDVQGAVRTPRHSVEKSIEEGIIKGMEEARKCQEIAERDPEEGDM